MHVARLRRTGSLDGVRQRANGSAAQRDDEGRKFCPKCSQWLDVENFHAHPLAADGLKTPCKVCHVLAVYGLNRTTYEALLVAQGGVCAICKEPPGARVLVVDHDHSCCAGRRSCGSCVRGLLCGSCNSGIGYLRESPTILANAANYLATMGNGEGTSFVMLNGITFYPE